MDKDYEIVVFSDDWSGLPFSCKHLLKHFLPDVRLIWVETIGLRSPGLNLYDIKRSFQKLKGWFSRDENLEVNTLPNNLQIIDPFQIPYNQFGFIRKLNARLMAKTLKQLSPKENGKRIFLTTWPFMGGVTGKIDDDISIYYRVDDFAEFPGVNKPLIQRLENEIIQNVDLVVASAENLTQFKPGTRAQYLPHGVDYNHFSIDRALTEMPEKLRGFKTPLVGFFGLLNSWLDLEVIRDSALLNPEMSYIIIGPSQLPDSQLPKAPNMHYLGAVPYEKLPEYAVFFDVALIPFKINDLTIAVNPLKLMEYFALGVPVVSTPLPEVTKYEATVEIGGSAEEITTAIKKAISEDTAEKRETRKNIASNKSWKSMSEQLQSWIEAELDQEKSDGG